ncbi:MAG: acyl-CoA/acyl-ACP dehydrogenase [Planctomycetes bacterium]|nr:acyl-CoA/acyl-ACP dehydrogenase [Planctomycetota bacterium]
MPTPISARAGEPTFAETALKLGGKSDEEVRRMGAMDKADDQVESLFRQQHQTANSPIHRAVWDKSVPIDQFVMDSTPTSLQADRVMRDSLQVVEEHLFRGTLHDDRRKLRAEVLNNLGAAGYWGLLVDKEYGGAGTSFSQFAPFLTKMAQFDPTIAGLASVHGCIGAVDPLQTFGNVEQKLRFLPKLASGERLSAFALTEPCAGSDLTALRTVAVKRGDTYYVTGEKLFITNVTPGRTIGLVCLIEGRPAVLIVDLPQEENETFQLKQYGLYALKHAHNQGIVFQDFPVPVENLLDPGDGDGLSIAYHGLNRGRVALCANAAGTMRLMLANMVPWSRFRKTYGHAIETRELVQRRMGHLAGLIVACDALTEWTAGLLDRGYRGEMECIIAKIFGSESQKEAAIELFMKTHGGRSFLHGHLFGDNVHEFLAPCIYEGEGEMLGMAFFKSLVKHHGRQFFEPIGMALAANGIKHPNMANPKHLWALKGPLMNYGKWFIGRSLHRARYDLPEMPYRLQDHADFAATWLQHSALEISGTMRKFQLKLADRQCRMAELSGRVQLAVVILCTSLYAARHDNDVIAEAADTVCQELRRRLLGGLPTDGYFKQVTALGKAVAEGHFPHLDETPQAGLMMPYQNR